MRITYWLGPVAAHVMRGVSGGEDEIRACVHFQNRARTVANQPLSLAPLSAPLTRGLLRVRQKWLKSRKLIFGQPEEVAIHRSSPFGERTFTHPVGTCYSATPFLKPSAMKIPYVDIEFDHSAQPRGDHCRSGSRSHNGQHRHRTLLWCFGCCARHLGRD